MARFTIRVELHGATEKDYEKLHAAMEEKGFSKTITGSDGNEYHLPLAEYDYQSDDPLEMVREEVANVAAAVMKNPAVLVTQGVRAWSGLKKVDG